jgi:DNA polymerase III epsilon subunit-like protein
MLENEMFLIIDTETTGTDPNTSQILELSAVSLTKENGGYARRVLISTYCNPRVEIPASAQEIHGITEEKIKYTPHPRVSLFILSTVINSLKEEYDVFVGGHNYEYYDHQVMSSASEEYSELPIKMLDTFNIGRRLYPNLDSHKLSDLYETVTSKNLTGAHAAAVDCLAVSYLIPQMLRDSEASSLQELYEQMQKGVVFDTFPFGKHKGKKPWDVPKGYARWCLNNFDNMSKDTEATLQYVCEHGK